MSAVEFVKAARALRGARWRHRGRARWAVDCIGLIVLAGEDAGMRLNDQVGYGREPWDDQLRRACIAHWGYPLSAEHAQPGDVALIRWGTGEPSHLAIIGNHPDGGLTLIHAHTLHGVIEQSLADRFVQVVVEVYRPWSASVN